MKAERIHNLWGPADRAPAPEALILELARNHFDAQVLIDVIGNTPRTRLNAIAYLEQVYRAFCTMVTPSDAVPIPAGRAVMNRSQASLMLFEHARVEFAFSDEGLIGRAPTHFYRGLP